MKLEIQKNNMRPYIYASIIITVTMIGLIYLFAYAPHLEPNDPDLFIFAGYDNVIQLYGVVNMTVFCVLSCVIYSRFIIEAYKEKQLILLFSYPVNHKKILFSKIFIVSLFISLSMIICNVIVFGIFLLTESFVPIIADVFSVELILGALKTTLIMIISAASLSVIATGIGFYTKSVPAAIIAGVILCSIFCNVVFNALGNEMPILIFMMMALLAGAVMAILLMNKVNKLEVL
jgi:ABC-type transport system involved in multi-copper enzyme maturation permease subunit